MKDINRKFFTQQSLKNYISFAIADCFFTVANILFKKDIEIPVWIDLALFPENYFFIYLIWIKLQMKIFLESSRAVKYHGIETSITNFCAIYHASEFANSLKYLCPNNLDWK